MKLYKKNIAILMAGLLTLASGALVTACDEEDDLDTNQFAGSTVKLNAASLQVTRGGYMTFKGVNLDRITSIQFPGGVSSTPEKVDQYTIKCLVPEEAEPGTVKLIYDGGELETKEIAFTEPITFDSFAPESVTAGDELTIKGTYLTYIEFVQFATGENVEVTPTSRTEFKVTVPVDASTGVINLGYYTIDGKDTVETLLQSEAELTVIETSDAKLTNSTVKAGQNVEITGKLLRLVKSVTFNGVDAIDVAAEDPTKDVEKITVALPATAQDGEVTLTLLSGNTVSAGEIKTVVPTAAIKDAKASYGIDETVVISGENLDLITAAQFNGESAATAIAKLDENGDITLKVTSAAKSGDITLSLANGVTLTVSGFVTTKPAFTFPASATPLDVVTVESTLAERITTLKFGSIEAAVTAKDGTFSFTVPLEAESGSVTYVMDNGEEGVASESFTVNSYTFCAVYKFAAEETSLGELLECEVKNSASLTDVLIGGVHTEYLQVGAKLYVNVGTETGDVKMTLVSGETNVDYTINVVGAGLVETVLWVGAINLDAWSANYETMVDFSGVPSDAKIRINFTANGSEPKIKIFDGHWGNIYDGTTEDNVAAQFANGYVDLDPSLLPYSDWGYSIIFQGDAMVISSVSWVKDYSAPKAIWTGSFSNAGWVGNQDLAWGGYDWSTVKAGQTLYFTVEKVNKGAWGCLSLRTGTSWSALADAVNASGSNQFDFGDDVDATTYEFSLTQAAVDDLVANNGLVMTGDNIIITQVAIK